MTSDKIHFMRLRLILQTSCLTKVLVILLLFSLVGWDSCKNPNEYMAYVIKQPSGYLNPVWQNSNLNEVVDVNYDMFSDSDGLITESAEHSTGMLKLMQTGNELDQVYYDAAHGNVRAQHCLQKIEATVACAGVAIAEEVYSLKCSLVQLPSCIPQWAKIDALLGKTSLSQKLLRQIMAQNYEHRAKDLKLESEIISAGIQLFFTAWMLKDLRAAVMVAENRASQSLILNGEGFTAKVTIADAEASAVTKLPKPSNTVWDYIKATDETLAGTSIPKSFELELGGQKVWVHPNATKHMQEYLKRYGVSHGAPINSQTLLTSFREAIMTATKQGMQFEKMIVTDNWELIFSPARPGGALPVIKHALYKP